MKKFTVFTVILSIIIVVVVAEMLVNEYLPQFSQKETNASFTLPKTLNISDGAFTNVLGGDLNNKLGGDLEIGNNLTTDSSSVDEVLGIEEFSDELENPDGPTELFTYPEEKQVSPSFSGDRDFEDLTSGSSTVSTNVLLREDQVRSAGFATAYIESDPSDGKIFKTVIVDDIENAEVSRYAVRTADSLLTKVYVIKANLDANINEIYQLVKMRSSDGLSMEINETNDFGLASFYVNDSRRPETAFLVVRISGYIYGFSYPKEFHAQIKNLIQLLEWEFS